MALVVIRRLARSASLSPLCLALRAFKLGLGAVELRLIRRGSIVNRQVALLDLLAFLECTLSRYPLNARPHSTFPAIRAGRWDLDKVHFKEARSGSKRAPAVHDDPRPYQRSRPPPGRFERAQSQAELAKIEPNAPNV